MHCKKPKRIGREENGNLRYVDCRKCLPCRLSRQYDWANRLQWEIARTGPERCFFFTGTFTDEALEEFCMSEVSPAGHLNPRQQKLAKRLEIKVAKIMRTDWDTREHWRAKRLLSEMMEHQEPVPTVKRKLWQDWKKRCRERLGFMPRILTVGEYGSRFGRPHGHAVLIGLHENDAQKCQDAWPHSKDFKPIEPVQSEKVGGYISKDIVKGTPEKESYIASGREAPFMVHPQRPYLASGQEDEIFNALSRLQARSNAYDFEHRLRLQGVGRTFCIRSGKDNGKKLHIPYGRTAYHKAVARLGPRDPELVELLLEQERQRAFFQVTHSDPDHRHCRETGGAHKDQRDAKLEQATIASDRAQRNHRRLLQRRGIPS